MKPKQIIVEVIVCLLMLNFFYEGIYKIVNWGSYESWLRHAPLLNSVAGILKYLIPIGEIALSLSFVVSSYRTTAFSITAIITMIFVLWIMSWILFTHRIYLPHHALWKSHTWMQKMSISVGLAWLAIIAIKLSEKNIHKEQRSSKTLRNLPANAQ